MGWKAACILINERQPGYLGTLPQHHPDRAAELIHSLGLGDYRSIGMTTLEQAIYPQPGELYIGAYDGAAVIAQVDLTQACFTKTIPPSVEGLLLTFPRGAILAMILHSVVDLFGYAYYEHGSRLRVRAGSVDDGIFLNEGTPLLEETADPQRALVGDEVDAEPPDPGDFDFEEEASRIFAIGVRFLGIRLDEAVDEMRLPVEQFQLMKKKHWWQRLFQRQSAPRAGQGPSPAV